MGTNPWWQPAVAANWGSVENSKYCECFFLIQPHITTTDSVKGRRKDKLTIRNQIQAELGTCSKKDIKTWLWDQEWNSGLWFRNPFRRSIWEIKGKAGPAGATPKWLQKQQRAVETQSHGVPEEFGLEKPSHITSVTPPSPPGPPLTPGTSTWLFWTLPVIPPLPWRACSNAWQPFRGKTFPSYQT